MGQSTASRVSPWPTLRSCPPSRLEHRICPTSFCTSLTGTYGSIEWVSVYSSIEQLQRGQEAIAADADFAQLLDKELRKVYLPGAVQLAWRKIA
jgi:hypothetical protein